MSEEKTALKTKITPLSVASVGPLNALIFQKDTETDAGTTSEVLISIKRNPMKPDDDPSAIPILELPALVMLLKAVAEPSMTVRSLTPVAPAVPAAPKKTTRRRKK